MARDQFEVLQELGEGGFARVFKAREKSTGRTVALKRLKESLHADAEVLERFRREIFAVATIDSPYVVRMYDFGVDGGDSFLAMEFVEGTALRDVLVGQPWSAPDVQVIIGQVCQALAAAHRVGIIHRDLKPENIMLVPQKDGTRHVKVLDFGFAKLLDLERQLELEPLTQVGFCFGTPQYMAPEQIQGRSAEPSVDLFATAVIAYEMISGQLPWDGRDARDVFTRVLTHPPPRIARVHPSLAPRLAEINELLARSLAKPKRARPPSAESLFERLEVALFGASQSRGAGTFASVMGRTISIPNFAFDPTPSAGVPVLVDPSGEGSDPLRTTMPDGGGEGTFAGGPTFGGRTEVDASPKLAALVMTPPHLAAPVLTPGGMPPPPMTPPPPTLPAPPHPPRPTPRHLRSGWQPSLAHLPGVALPDDDELDTHERKRTPPRAHRSETMQVETPPASRVGPSLWWLVLLAVLLAGFIGYYAGSIRR